MNNLVTGLGKLEEVVGLMVVREGRILYTSLPQDVYPPEVQERLQQAIDEMAATFRSTGDDSPQEFVSLYERGSLVFREAFGFFIVVILRSPVPNPMVSVALNALALRIEKLARKKAVESTELVPLATFAPIVKMLVPQYGPAAKLIVKRALKAAEATEKGLPLGNVPLFVKAIRKTVDDPELAEQVAGRIEELVRERRGA